MQKSQSTSQIQGRRRRMRLLQIVVVALLLWACWVYYTQSRQIAEKQSKLAELQGQAAVVNQEKNRLELQVKRLHDNEYIGELARKNFFLSKEGEILFLTPEETKKKQ
ncbi:FtsB family cell division protein [Aneurinibacillus tyrosinisolvens]|uniref:FtsB family cell division protein n=1 Tax=Aneurinibacillus tyrosinisolvens TaxID=1443435 RepID=UPI00063F7B90|nr:septum formation initiator family protein [Aneurinibacillus tyrosinisolvens]